MEQEEKKATGRPKGKKDSYKRTRRKRNPVTGELMGPLPKKKGRKSRRKKRPVGRPRKRFVGYYRKNPEKYHLAWSSVQDGKFYQRENQYNFMFRLPLARKYIMDKLTLKEIRHFDILMVMCGFEYCTAQEVSWMMGYDEEITRKRIEELENKFWVVKKVGDAPEWAMYMGDTKEKRLYSPTHKARIHASMFYKLLLGIEELPDWF